MSTSHSEKRVEQREEFPRFLDMYRSYCTRQHASLSICVCVGGGVSRVNTVRVFRSEVRSSGRGGVMQMIAEGQLLDVSQQQADGSLAVFVAAGRRLRLQTQSC